MSECNKENSRIISEKNPYLCKKRHLLNNFERIFGGTPEKKTLEKLIEEFQEKF